MQKEKVITVGTQASQWLEDRYDRWSVRTQSGYRNLVERHIVPGIGRASLRKLNVHRIEGFYKALAEKGLGAQSIWCVHLLLRRMLDEACRTGQIAFNPAALCKLPQGAAHEALPLRRGQLERYLKAAEERNALPLLYIGLTIGLRFADLRHTFATLAMQSGVDVKTLAGMLGHYSAGFTLDTYTHITHQMQHGAAEKIGGFMAGVRADTQQHRLPGVRQSR